MPQHSLGASARACSTIVSYSAREIRIVTPRLPAGLGLPTYPRPWTNATGTAFVMSPGSSASLSSVSVLRLARHDLGAAEHQPRVGELRDRVVVRAFGDLFDLDQEPEAVAFGTELRDASQSTCLPTRIASSALALAAVRLGGIEPPRIRSSRASTLACTRSYDSSRRANARVLDRQLPGGDDALVNGDDEQLDGERRIEQLAVGLGSRGSVRLRGDQQRPRGTEPTATSSLARPPRGASLPRGRPSRVGSLLAAWRRTRREADRAPARCGGSQRAESHWRGSRTAPPARSPRDDRNRAEVGRDLRMLERVQQSQDVGPSPRPAERIVRLRLVRHAPGMHDHRIELARVVQLLLEKLLGCVVSRAIEQWSARRCRPRSPCTHDRAAG